MTASLETMGRIAAMGALLALASCISLDPDYERPTAPVPQAWPQGPAYAPAIAESADQELPQWRDFFADEKLRGVLELALQQNRDLRIAALNIERARAAYRIQRAQSLPTIEGGVAGDVRRTPAALSPTGDNQTTREYSASVGFAAFELDLFGRVRSLNRAALQDYLATAAARDSVQISLIGETASLYIQYAGDLALLKLAQDTLASRRQSLELTQRRFEAGASSELDVHRAETTVESARADAAHYTTLAAQDENALALLVGAPIPDALKPASSDQVAFGVSELASGLPSTVMLRRPDISEAEHVLIGANADIGAARAAFFPSVTISAAGGQADPRFENLFSGAGAAWSFAPQINLPIFDGGARGARLGVARVDRDIAVAQYERSIQSAFREVADALAERGTIEEQFAARQALANAAENSYRLSEARYREGVDNYLSLLDAQRELYAAQQGLVAARVDRAANFVTLYKVLGGGV
jgi:multidrug efflux system outer membrane protein